MLSRSSDAAQRDSEQISAWPTTPRWNVLHAMIRGVIGGLIATGLMTIYRFPLFRALPPTAEFWATFVGGGEPEEYPVVGLLLHVLYGSVGGAVFGAGFSLINFKSERDRRLGALALSTVYGLALSVFGTQVIFKRLLGKELEPDEEAVFHVAHVIYGLTLGTWMISRERIGEVYE